MRRNSRWSGFVGTDGSHHGIARNSEGAFRAFDGKGGAIASLLRDTGVLRCREPAGKCRRQLGV